VENLEARREFFVALTECRSVGARRHGNHGKTARENGQTGGFCDANTIDGVSPGRINKSHVMFRMRE
jgi:hypothetical protein